MGDPALADRMDSVESYMKDLSFQALRTERELARLSAEMREFKDEMRQFKKEMSSFKDEMLEFKNEMVGFKNEMLEFKDEMVGFKDEMRVFKTQAELDRREMNRKWGELANKMGTMVEDLVAPNLPRVARELFDCEAPPYFAIRALRRRGAETLELDALVVCESVVMINETKSRLRAGDVDEVLDKLRILPDFFPEFQDLRPVGILASLRADDSLVNYATRKGVLVMAMGDETMEVLNPEAAAGGW